MQQHVPPENPFDPFVPSDSEPWNVQRANHLARRAAFGATADTLDAMLKQSPADAVESFLNYNPDEDPFEDMIGELEGFINLNRIDSVQGYWLHRMLRTPRPMQEKIALFFHGHLTSGSSKVGNGRLMHNQIELFRRKGLGSYRDLLIAVGRDPAMLIWLDGQYSKKGKANENYGREVMELFTLGEGNYSEQDVRELSRAFTGWQIRGETAVLNKSLFDDGEKEILGEKGKFDSESAIDLLLRQKPAPKFLSKKLLREFVHPKPEPEHIDHYAKRLLHHKWQLKPVLKEILTSRLFFSDWAYRSKIKSPIELAVGAARAVGGRVSTDFVRDQCNRMGQNLLNPPDVSGWTGEEGWINANTVLVRFNFGLAMAAQGNNYFVRREDLNGWLTKRDIKTPVDVLNLYSHVLVDDNISREARAKLLDYMNRDRKNEIAEKFQFNNDWINSKVRGLIHLILTMPEAQMA